MSRRSGRVVADFVGGRAYRSKYEHAARHRLDPGGNHVDTRCRRRRHGRDWRIRGPADVRRAGHAVARTSRSSSSTSRPRAARRRRVVDHRDRRGQGRAGEVLGEFQTLVKPSDEIPAFIAVLTGITNAMVATAPRIETALPSFLEFARGMRAGGSQRAVRRRLPPPLQPRRWASTGRGSRCSTRPSSPAGSSRATTRPTASCRRWPGSSAPARRPTTGRCPMPAATVDVLHGLMERLGNLGVHTLEELQTFSSRVSPGQRRKRHLAEQLPHPPGVYLFRDAQRRVLYVGTSKDLRNRVRTYFTASETRSRMGEMVGLAESVEGIVCATALEAEVRELRLIAEHKPRYNRRSKFPERVTWVKLTVEPWPRLSHGQAGAGRRRRLPRAVPLPQGRRGRDGRPARELPDPAVQRPAAPAPEVAVPARWPRWGAACRRATARSRWPTTPSPSRRCASPSTPARPGDRGAARRMEQLAADERFEEATAHRNRLTSFIRGCRDRSGCGR